MRLADCYRLLELDPGASPEEVKRAHRDLTKVWHPDRFEHDAPLRVKAEEKLKAINEAYATIRASNGRASDDAPDDSDAQNGWRVRSRGREVYVADLEAVARLVVRGAIGHEAELLDPSTRRWIPISSVPQLRNPLALARARRNRGWAVTFGSLALFILLRRPTPGGLLIALAVGGIALYFVFLAQKRD